MTRIALCALALVPALGACGGGDGAREDGAAGETGRTPAEAPETAPPKQAPQVITEAESGEEIALPVGGETNLRLSGEYAWSEPSVRGDAVQLARVDYLQDPGFSEWVVTAVGPGSATIAAVGEQKCPENAEGCPDEPLAFQVTITVT